MKQLREWITVLFSEKRPRRCLFRVDAGSIPGLSFGHASRCLTLSHVLGEIFGSRRIFCMRDYPEGTAHVKRAGEEVFIIPRDLSDRNESAIVMSLARDIRPDWYIIDLPYNGMDTSYFSALRAQGTRVLLIDDMRFITPEVDAIINSTVLAPDRKEYSEVSETRCYLGPDHLIFDSQGARKTVLAGRRDGFEVLITFGGSDPEGLTEKVLKTVTAFPWPGVCFTVILGPGYKEALHVTDLLARHEKFMVENNPPDLKPYLARCDMAVCSGGMTLSELHCLDKPVIAVASADHEAVNIRAFLDRGLIPHGFATWEPGQFLEALRSLVEKSMKTPAGSSQDSSR